MDNRQKNASVDDILDEIKRRKGPETGPKGPTSVDDVLAELGYKSASGLPVIPKRPAAAEKPAAAVPPAQAAPPQREEPAPAEAAVQKQAAPQWGEPDSLPGEPVAPRRETEPAQPAEEAAVAPAEEKAAAPYGGPLFEGEEAEVKQPRARKQAGDDSVASTRELQNAIRDVKTEFFDAVPRVGKAAALERVDSDKFVGDEELNRWFGGEDDGLSAKERKRAEKEQRKAEKEAEKERKRAEKEERRRAKKGYDDLDEEDFGPRPEETEEGYGYEEDSEPGYREPEGAGAQPAWPEEDAAAQAAFDSPEDYDLTGHGQGPLPDLEVTLAFPAIHPTAEEDVSATQAFAAAMQPAEPEPEPDLAAPEGEEEYDTRSFELDGEEPEKVPTAAFTQEFDTAEEAVEGGQKNLYLDDMVDDKFRQFFSETAIIDKEEVNRSAKGGWRKKKKSRSAILTGEFAKLAEMAEASEEDAFAEDVEEEYEGFDDYDRPQDAEAIEEDIASLRKTLSRRTFITAVAGALLLWMGFAFGGSLPVPKFMSLAEAPFVFIGVYLGLLLIAIGVNFTTFATGIIGLGGAPTVDTPPALATLAALLQGVMLLVQQLQAKPVEGTLFGALAALLLCFNAFGKRVRAVSILRNFKLASAGMDHSAAYVLDNSSELAYNITKGLEEEYPTLLISRPTALVKGFLRQSFSQRATDRTARIMGWVLLGISLVAAAVTWLVVEQNIFTAVTAFAAVLCIAAPFSSSLVSGIPSSLLQKNTARVGAVVPGWSAIEELGGVNVVMATARDVFPPSAVYLKGIKTFEKERIDLAILYAASVLIEGCDTLRDIFMGVIQGKNDMLYKVESLTKEPGRGFTAWVENNRVVIGSREMLQKHDIQPPPMEIEVKFVPEGHMPVYLAVSGKLFAMFIVGYGADPEVRETLNGLIKSGVSLLINSDDMNVTNELIEHAYRLPPGVVKVLGRKELEIMEPLTSYVPESEGVMTHIGTFASFIGGMRAAAGCAASEKMASIVQMASMILAGGLCLLLAFTGGLASLSIGIALLYQLGWTFLVSALPFARRY